MDPAFEIRKLKPSQVHELVRILETHELWKKLMAIIPKNLRRFEYTCDLSITNPHKYNSEHFRIIENASMKTKRSCTEILLEEWGTSGRVLPTVGHLLYLLTKAKLFRAADYVAESLLNQPKPQRPDQGPEAPVLIDSLCSTTNNKTEDDIEKLLDEIDYPSSAVKQILLINSRNVLKPTAPVIPEIIVTPSVTPHDNDDKTAPNALACVVKPNRDYNSESDLIKFSSKSIKSETVSNAKVQSKDVNGNTNESCSCSINESTQVELPEISALLHSEDKENLPDLSLIDGSSKYPTGNPALSELLSEKNPQTSDNIPCLSALVDSKTSNENSCCEDNIPNLSALQSKNVISEVISNENVPNSSYSPILSALMNRTNEVSDNSFSSNEYNSSSNASENIADLSALPLHKSKSILAERSMNKSNSSIESLMGNENKGRSYSIHVSSSDTNSRPCNSPLPQLSLNTQLPHFSYSDLMKATNDFNTDLYVDEVGSGRFLGSGAFGSVFLAFGLTNKPVAVKKLMLENVDYVDIDATVTKQFKNEVEILGHYKHPNLLSLIGYSCDGCTYCLLYEYVQGGALNVRLEAKANKLQWKQRLKIAVGTANAIAYLHTAFSTPLIHRDIKSANILLNYSYTPKLCDFGLIKLSPSQNTATATTVFGTSAYMAPEAFRGDISVKMDTFSFGVVLLELLTSLPPVDENREGTDLVTHIGESCDESSISPLLDREAGSWTEDDINYDEEVYKIALMCLEEKKRRPKMVTVRDLLSDLTKRFVR